MLISKFIRFFIERAPKKQAILGLYAVVVLMIYSWTLATSFYKLPSWSFFLTAGQIASMYAYAFSVNLAESLFALVGLLLLDCTLFFPLKNKEEFQARQIVTALTLLASSVGRLVFFKNMLNNADGPVITEFAWWACTLTIGLPIAIFIPKIKQARIALDAFAERSLVFLYFYIPLSVISIIVVIIRNIS